MHDDGSDRILSNLELSVLKKRLNFTVTPIQVPVIDMITVTETACRNLNKWDANELRAKMITIVDRSNKTNDQNASKEEMESIHNLKKDDSIIYFRISMKMNIKNC